MRGFESCVRTIRSVRRRAGQLDRARRLELGGCTSTEVDCKPNERSVVEARRAYASLSRFEDTGPDALLAIARLARMTGKADVATRRYAELRKRFGQRADVDGVSYELIADLGIAQASSGAGLLSFYAKLIDRHYHAPPAVLSIIADQVRGDLGTRAMPDGASGQLQVLDARLETARAEAERAAGIAGEVLEVARSAEALPRGRPARDNRRTLVYQRLENGSVIGIVVDREMLEAVASRADVNVSELAVGARVQIASVGTLRQGQARIRTLSSAGFGPTLPHLTLALVNDRSQPDPLDEIVQTRGRRHLGITGGLVALLVVGLIATIRGAARERELARLKSDFVTTVSHELKTPLTSIRMFAEMLQQDVAGADRQREQRYHDIIVKESERLGLLIANLLDYSQIERGTRRYSQQRERVADVVTEAIETFQRFRDNDKPAVTVAVSDEARDIEVIVDREVVVQAILNLLANATKYGGVDHPIDVSVEARSGERVVLSVRDRGPGIPAAEQPRIFREFYRAPAAYSSGVEGTGLGLALVKRHVEAQGGQVELDSDLGSGSTFSLVFPGVT